MWDPHGRRGGLAALWGSFLLVVPPLCVREVEFAYLKFCYFFMYARTIWLEISARRAEQGLGATAGLGAAPNKLVHSPPPAAVLAGSRCVV